MPHYDVTAWRNLPEYTTLTIEAPNPTAAIEIMQTRVKEADVDDWTATDEAHDPHFMEALPNTDAPGNPDVDDPEHCDDWNLTPADPDPAKERAARAMLAALESDVLAMEATVARLCRYAGVDSVDPPGWFRSEHSALFEAIDCNRRAIAAAQAAGITTDGAQPEPPKPTTVYISTYTNKHGPGTRAFSTKEARDKYSLTLARALWAQDTNDEPPEEPADFWTAFYERFPDYDIQDDEPEIDSTDPITAARNDAG